MKSERCSNTLHMLHVETSTLRLTKNRWGHGTIRFVFYEKKSPNKRSLRGQRTTACLGSRAGTMICAQTQTLRRNNVEVSFALIPKRIVADWRNEFFPTCPPTPTLPPPRAPIMPDIVRNRPPHISRGQFSDNP